MGSQVQAAAIELDQRWTFFMSVTPSPTIDPARGLAAAMSREGIEDDLDLLSFRSLVRRIAAEHGVGEKDLEDTYDTMLDQGAFT